jgi:hypothetical protein
MARRGGIFYGCKDKEDIQEAFQVNKFDMFRLEIILLVVIHHDIQIKYLKY